MSTFLNTGTTETRHFYLVVDYDLRGRFVHRLACMKDPAVSGVDSLSFYNF